MALLDKFLSFDFTQSQLDSTALEIDSGISPCLKGGFRNSWTGPGPGPTNPKSANEQKRVNHRDKNPLRRIAYPVIASVSQIDGEKFSNSF